MRQEKFVKGYLQDGDHKRAALEAGYGKKNLASTGKALTNRPEVKSKVLKELEKAGITEELLAGKLREQLDANRIIKSGEEYPDWDVRHKGIEVAYKIYGAFTEKVEIKHDITYEDLTLTEMINIARERGLIS